MADTVLPSYDGIVLLSTQQQEVCSVRFAALRSHCKLISLFSMAASETLDKCHNNEARLKCLADTVLPSYDSIV